MANYKISDTTLTSIGDAVRGKVGETRVEQVPVENPRNFYFNMRDYAYDDFEPSDDVNTYRWAFIPIEMPYGTKKFRFVYTPENAFMREPMLVGISPDSPSINSTTLQSFPIVNATTEKSIERTLTGDCLLYYKQMIEKVRYNGGAAYQYKIEGQFYFYNDNNELITTLDVDVKNTMTPEQMAQAINDMAPAPTDEDLVFTGNCSYKFYGGWDWVINKYGDKIKTKELTNADYMFSYLSGIEEIPFDINFKNDGGSVQYMFSYSTSLEKVQSIDFKHTTSYRNMKNLFSGCHNLKEIGTLKNLYPEDFSSVFSDCWHLRELPQLENFNYSRIRTYKYGTIGYLFNNCYSLRKIPSELLKELYTPLATSPSYSLMYYGFNYCHVLDEINGIVPATNTMTSNMFNHTFSNCYRLKDVTFALQEDGTPYQVKWKSQTIDLSDGTGYCQKGYALDLNNWEESRIREAAKPITNYNSGITLDKCIYNDETYALLKDDEDAFCLANTNVSYTDYSYSRYNHDSAVNTINSLPDTSAYLATAGGTNTIKFRGRAGGKTDGGAINTLTAEEIAVATAKGWTVSFM